MTNKNYFAFFALIAVVLLTGGCTTVSNKTENTNNGGVFKSTDQGLTWAQKGLVASTQAKQLSIAAVNNSVMVMDPSDDQALYFGSIDNGLFYSYDGADSWNRVKDLGNASVRALAIAPTDKCRIYAAVNNRLYRSDDCNRTYKQTYYDNDVAATVDAVAIDKYNNDIVYIGLSRGDLVKSADRGDSWQTQYRFNDKINRVIIDPNDTRRIYVATTKKGLWRSYDSGVTWVEMSPILKEADLGSEIRDVVITEGENPIILIATTYGMIRSRDQGENWEQIELIQPEKKATINAVAVSPANPDHLYYVTYTTFFRSIDGGQNWSTAKLPTTRAGWKLLIDPKDPKTLYMSVRSFEN